MNSTDHQTLSLLVNMAGSICLLLWGSFTVRTAVERSFSTTLDRLISGASGRSIRAVGGGLMAALIMQSATATVLLATGLLSSGTLSLAAAMGVVLGADLGSAIASRILFLNLSLLPPILLIGGMLLHLLANSWRGRYLGRILIGIGLMLLSIQWMKSLIGPLTEQPLPADWLSVLQSVPWFAMFVVTLATWFAHSSVAIVLVIASLAHSGLVPSSLFLPMLLGANIGAGLIALPMVERSNLDGRSVVLCNIALRTVLALAALVLLPVWADILGIRVSDPGEQVILAHLLFNGLLVLIFLPFAGSMAGKIRAWLYVRESAAGLSEVNAAGASLDPSLLQQPVHALACARREAFRLGDSVEAMLSRALLMFEAADRSEINRLVEADREINQRNKAIHRYLSEARRHISDENLEHQLDNLLHFSAAMENIGDIVSHDLSRMAVKRLDRAVAFSAAGYEEISAIHTDVLALLRATLNQFASDGTRPLEKLQQRVEHIRKLCDQSVARHRRRLTDHHSDSIGTSSIHQDTVRNLLQVAVLLEYQLN